MRYIVRAAVAAACIVMAACQRGTGRLSSRSEFVLGTVCTISLYEDAPKELYREVFDRLRALEDIFSAGLEGSGLDMVNRRAGTGPAAASPELITVLQRAVDIARLSGGAFDPTVGPLVKLWDIGGEHPRVPGDAEIQEALGLINFRDITIDEAAGTAALARPGQALDLGGIAKGFAADEAAAILRGKGVESGIIDLGGNIFALGRARGRPWRIGVQDPRQSRGAYLGVVEAEDISVVTSGIYERFFEEAGTRYHHILSTAAGRPVDNGLLAVTILAKRSIDADALSTAVFALGEAEGRALLAAVPGAEAIFVFADSTVMVTEGLTESFSLSGGAYRLRD